MRPYHSVLICGGRRPVRCGLVDIESRNGDVADSVLLRHKASLSYVDFDFLFVRILSLKVTVEYRASVFLFRKPLQFRGFRFPRACIDFSLSAFFD